MNLLVPLKGGEVRYCLNTSYLLKKDSPCGVNGVLLIMLFRMLNTVRTG
jgi:hypothetical protein